MSKQSARSQQLATMSKRMGLQHFAVGSLVETYIHIMRLRALTERENSDLHALLAWGKKRTEIVLRVQRSETFEWLDAALADLGPAPIPAERPVRPGREVSR